jgi:hypothetical protein
MPDSVSAKPVHGGEAAKSRPTLARRARAAQAAAKKWQSPTARAQTNSARR